MGDIAKIVKIDGDQAIRLPAEYRMDAEEVEIERQGDHIVVRPRQGASWRALLAALSSFDAQRYADCFPAGREQPDDSEGPNLDTSLRR